MTTRKAIIPPDDLDTQLAEVGAMWGVGNERHIEQFVSDVREALGAEVIELTEETGAEEGPVLRGGLSRRERRRHDRSEQFWAEMKALGMPQHLIDQVMANRALQERRNRGVMGWMMAGLMSLAIWSGVIWWMT